MAKKKTETPNTPLEEIKQAVVEEEQKLERKFVSKRFLFTILMVLVIAAGAGIAAFLVNGYRLSPDTGTIAGTGILSVTSLPEQASVYVDGALTAATNTNVNSLPPKEYNVRIVKEGYIPWEKKVTVHAGLVTEIKATLFRTIPTVYPLTYTGAEKVMISPDEQKIVYVVPPNNEDALANRKSGIWVWVMTDQPIGFARGGGLQQVAPIMQGLDYSQANLRFSPDSTQLLVSFPERHFLVDLNRFNDPPRDITPTVNPTLQVWDQETKKQADTRLDTIKDLTLRKTASSSAYLKWAPDETKVIYSTDGQNDFKVLDLLTKEEFSLPKALGYLWLPSSEHVALIENFDNPPAGGPTPSPTNRNQPQATPSADPFINAKVSVVEYDGHNKAEIFAGKLDPKSVYVWPDGSKIVMVSSLPLATASTPNLYGVNLK